MLPTFRTWAAEREAYATYERQLLKPSMTLAPAPLGEPVPLA